MRALWLVLGMTTLAITGCGFTVGDACTTPSDCGGQLCLTRSELPGGYCSVACTTDAQCASGSVCVPDGAGQGNSACYRTCTRESDCRGGYQCAQAHRLATLVCVGTQF